jgi:hypothetical protein
MKSCIFKIMMLLILSPQAYPQQPQGGAGEAVSLLLVSIPRRRAGGGSRHCWVRMPKSVTVPILQGSVCHLQELSPWRNKAGRACLCRIFQDIAGTFVLVSGIVYFAFMAAWLNLYLITCRSS